LKARPSDARGSNGHAENNNAFESRGEGRRFKVMNSTSELIHLHEAMVRLCKLYIAIEKKPDGEDVIEELKTEIMSIYTEIKSKGKESNSQSTTSRSFNRYH
jgi:hypothetical protein